MNLLERLRASQGKLIFAEGATPFQQLATEALKTAQQFPSGSRILLWSDDVRQIIVTLAGAERAGADVFIAHRTIGRAEIDSMLKRFAVTHLVQPGAIEQLKAQPGEPSRFVYVMTSGTTRAPKVARHTLSSLFGTIQGTQSSRRSRWLLTFPPTAFAGLQVIFSAVLGGGDLVLTPERTMEAFAGTAARHAVTHISGTPTFWRSFLLVLGDRELSLHQITVGGEAVDQATLDRLKQRFLSARITHIYASTEAGVGFSVRDCRAGIPAAWISSGVGDVQLRVNDGVLEIKSPRALKQYESGEATPLDSEGWLSSGDLVRLEGGPLPFCRTH